MQDREMICFGQKVEVLEENSVLHCQGSYASGKCQGKLKIFKVRELSGYFIICLGKLNFC